MHVGWGSAKFFLEEDERDTQWGAATCMGGRGGGGHDSESGNHDGWSQESKEVAKRF
jgi:hypothetical protein